MTDGRSRQFSGLLFAVGSAASFALSGVFGSAIMAAGWSPGAAVTTRIGLAALVLLGPTFVMLRGSWHLVRRAWAHVLLFGVLAIGLCQLAYFFAVQLIPPSIALLVEFTGPVLLMLFTWARTRVAPSLLTVIGAIVAVLGLIAIAGLVGGESLNPLGILFALGAAVGVAAYFALGAKTDHGIAPLPFTGLGLAVGAVILALASFSGLLPFVASSAPTEIGGAQVHAWMAVAGLVLISTVLSYALGVVAARRLGATVASFTGYSEPLFGIFWTILLLAILPTGMQWLGAVLILAGVVLVRVGELRASVRTAAGDEDAAESPSSPADTQ